MQIVLQHAVANILNGLEHTTKLKLLGADFLSNLLGCDISSIRFESKPGGVQIGVVAVVDNDKYYLKTHQSGQSMGSNESEFVDPAELIVYKLFQFLNLGPEVYFFFNQQVPKEFFIMTRGIVDFKTFSYVLQNSENSIDELVQTDIKTPVLLAELLSRILFLIDVNNNDENFGFVQDQLKIVDFIIHHDILEKNRLDEFEKDHISLVNKDGFKKQVHIESSKKLALGAKCFQELADRGFLSSLTQAQDSIDQYFAESKYIQRLERFPTLFEAWSERVKQSKYYVNKVKENFNKFETFFSKYINNA